MRARDVGQTKREERDGSASNQKKDKLKKRKQKEEVMHDDHELLLFPTQAHNLMEIQHTRNHRGFY